MKIYRLFAILLLCMCLFGCSDKKHSVSESSIDSTTEVTETTCVTTQTTENSTETTTITTTSTESVSTTMPETTTIAVTQQQQIIITQIEIITQNEPITTSPPDYSFEIGLLQIEINDCNSQISRYEAKIVELENQNVYYQNEINGYSIDLEQANTELTNAQNNKIKTYKGGSGWVYVADAEAIARAKEHISYYQGLIDTYQGYIDSNQANIENYNTEIANLRANIEIYQSQIDAFSQ